MYVCDENFNNRVSAIRTDERGIKNFAPKYVSYPFAVGSLMIDPSGSNACIRGRERVRLFNCCILDWLPSGSWGNANMIEFDGWGGTVVRRLRQMMNSQYFQCWRYDTRRVVRSTFRDFSPQTTRWPTPCRCVGYFDSRPPHSNGFKIPIFKTLEVSLGQNVFRSLCWRKTFILFSFWVCSDSPACTSKNSKNTTSL